MKKLEYIYGDSTTKIVTLWSEKVAGNKFMHLLFTSVTTLILLINFLNGYVEISAIISMSIIVLLWLMFFIMSATTHKLKIFAYGEYKFDEETRFDDITTDFGSELLADAMKMEVYQFNLLKISDVIDGDFEEIMVEFNSIGLGTEVALIRQKIIKK